MTVLDALQATLADEHAALYTYGVPGARTSQATSPALFETLTAGYRRHRARRDQLQLMVRDAGGVPLFRQGAMFDLTDRYEAEAARGAAEQRYRTLVEQIPVATYTHVVRTTGRDGTPNELWLITDRLELDAELVAAAYRYRWTVELFFRWLKCILGARHFVAENANGVALQMYAALIVGLLIALRTGGRPTKRTYELVQYYLLGWVGDAELEAYLAALRGPRSAPSR